MAIVLPLSQAQWICETSSFYCTIPCAAPHFGNRLRRKPVCADHGITAAATNQHTQKQQDKSGSDSAKTTVADPTQGNWTETYSSPTDLDGELDKAWLKCAPQNNPDPEAFAWKRSTDHSKVWLHATKGQMDGATQRSCMADELDIPDATELTTSWTKTALGDYDRIQRQSNNSIDIVWQYSNAVTASLSAQTDSYRVTLPYSWHNEVSISVDGNTITVTDKEHPNYSLCTFKVSKTPTQEISAIASSRDTKSAIRPCSCGPHDEHSAPSPTLRLYPPRTQRTLPNCKLETPLIMNRRSARFSPVTIPDCSPSTSSSRRTLLSVVFLDLRMTER